MTGKYSYSREVKLKELTDRILDGDSYTICRKKAVHEWDMPVATFKRYWREAQVRSQVAEVAVLEDTDQVLQNILTVEDKNEIANRIRAAEVERAVNRRINNILTREQRMQILSDIATLKLTTVKYFMTPSGLVSQEVTADISEVRNAIAELNKMDGNYAPAKSLNINENLEAITVTIVPPIVDQ